jgi:PhnB protein
MPTTVTAYLCCDGAAEALKFYAEAFGAEELSRIPDGDRLGHAEMRVGETTLYVSDEYPALGVRAPTSLGGAGASFVIHVPNADLAFGRAIAAGAKVDRPLMDSPFGRNGWVRDPWGHRWAIMSEAAPE